MEKNPEGKKGSNLQALINICIALLIFFLIRTFAVDILIIRGHSMEPSYGSGDIILVNKAAYGVIIPFINTYFIRWATPKQGDIVVFRNPEEKRLVIKRCAGIAGERILLTDDGLVVGNRTFPFKSTDIDAYHFTDGSVPENSIFVLGDNLKESVDSRQFGFISINEVYGKADPFRQGD